MKTIYKAKGMKLFLLLTLFVTLLQSCTKDPEPYNNVPIITYYYLSAWQLNQTPYFTNPAFDTISFACNKGDTLTFVKTKTDTTWYCERTTNNPDNNDQNCYQTIHNTYSTIKGNGSFDVKFFKKTSEASINTIYINFNGMYFHINSEWLNPSFNYLYSIGTYKINGRNFENSIYGYRILGDTTSDYLILNKENGVIQLNNKLLNTTHTIFEP